MNTNTVKVIFGNGQIDETYPTVEHAKQRILTEYPDAQFADEWEPTAPGYMGLTVVVSQLEADHHEIRIDADDYCYTHIGFRDYQGEPALYDGHYDPQCAGTVDDVLRYLTDLRQQVSGDDLTWEGSNGTWYSGSHAQDAISREIDSIRNGTHISIAGPDEA